MDFSVELVDKDMEISDEVRRLVATKMEELVEQEVAHMLDITHDAGMEEDNNRLQDLYRQLVQHQESQCTQTNQSLYLKFSTVLGKVLRLTTKPEFLLDTTQT